MLFYVGGGGGRRELGHTDCHWHHVKNHMIFFPIFLSHFNSVISHIVPLNNNDKA